MAKETHLISWTGTGPLRFPQRSATRLRQVFVHPDHSQALTNDRSTPVGGFGLSLMWCPLLGAAKQRIGKRLGSLATAGEGRQNLLCAYMAVAVLTGLLANTLFGVWWLDPAVGLLIAGLAVKEGWQSWRGEPCACCP